MNREKNFWYTYTIFWWSIVIIIAGLVYFMGVSHESIWWDESYSAFMASHSPIEILNFIHTDNHPPLYYILLSLVISIFGNSVWALRLLSVLGAVGLVSLGAVPVRRLFGNKTAFIYAGVVLFTPVVLIYAHEARMYSLANFCVTASALYGYLAVKNNRKWDWFGFGLASLAAAYLHYYGLMAAFYMHVAIFFWLILKKREFLKSYLFTGGVVILGYLPWLGLFLKQINFVSRGFWISAVSVEGILNAILQPFAYKEIFPPIMPRMVMVSIISISLILTGLILAKRSKAEDKWMFALFALGVFGCSFITPIFISLVSRPIFYERYIIVLDGLFLLLLSLGISVLPSKWLQAAALGLFAVLNIFTIKDIYTQYFNYPMQEVAGYLKNEIKPGDLVITSEQYSMGPALYYFPQAVHYYSNNSIEAQWQQVLEPLAPRLHNDQERDSLLSTHQSFWYISCNTGISKNIATILKGEKGWELSGQPVTFSEPYSKDNFTAAKYVYTGRETTLKEGTLNLHITDLNPAGNLLILIYNKDPLDDKFYRPYYINISGKEMTFPIDGLPFGEYAIVVYHDENVNYFPDIDDNTGLPEEGIGIVNMEKLDLSSLQKSFTFKNLKYLFNENNTTVDVRMFYPPFTMLINH